MTTERAELYRCRPPEGIWAPLLVRPLGVDEGIPLEAEIELAVWGLKGWR